MTPANHVALLPTLKYTPQPNTKGLWVKHNTVIVLHLAVQSARPKRRPTSQIDEEWRKQK